MGNVVIPPGDKTIGTSGHVADHNAIHRALAGAMAQNSVTVASVDAPDSVKDLATYVCDGVADQVQINQALLDATRNDDGISPALGMVAVDLLGYRFTISAPIKLTPNVTLRGQGRGTLIRPPTSDANDYAAIELYDTLSGRVGVQDLTIGRETWQWFAWNGIRLRGYIESGDPYGNMTGADSFSFIDNVHVHLSSRKGIHLDGMPGSGGNGYREVRVSNCFIINPLLEGIHVDSASDCKIYDNVVTGQLGTQPGFRIEGGNTMVGHCKVYYRGNSDSSPSASDGFYVGSSRVQLYGCEAQDNGGWGFNVQSSQVTLVGCLADCNAAKSTSAGGFQITGSGVFEGIHALGRSRNTYQQNRGIVFSGSPNVMVTGRVEVLTGNTHIVNSPGTGSYARVVRSGGTETTVYSFGT